jgi:hypothetical protein
LLALRSGLVELIIALEACIVKFLDVAFAGKSDCGK